MADSLAQFYVELKATGQTDLLRALHMVQKEIDANATAMQRMKVAMRPEVLKERVASTERLAVRQRELTKLTLEEQSRPEYVKARVASTIALEEAQRKLNEAIRQEREKYGEWVEKAPTALDRWRNALKQLHAEQEAFAGSAAMEKVREKYGTWVEKVPSHLDRWRAALKSVNAELQSQKDALMRVQAAMDPRKLEERVRNQIALEKAQERYNRALEAERRRQRGWGGTIMDVLGGILRGRGGILGSIGGLFGGGGSGGLFGGGGAMLAVGGPAGAIAAVAMQVVSSIKRMWTALQGIVATANPAVVELYNRAWRDLSAVIGRTLVPIIRMATQVVRVFADFLAQILPSASEWNKMMQELKPAMDELKQSLRELAPFIRDVLVIGIRAAAWSLGILARALATVNKVLMAPIRALNAVGLGPKPASEGGSMGAAAGQARYMDVEEVGRQAALSAFSQGAGGTVEKQTADNTRSAAETLQKILDFLQFHGVRSATEKKLEEAKGWIERQVNVVIKGW